MDERTLTDETSYTRFSRKTTRLLYFAFILILLSLVVAGASLWIALQRHSDDLCDLQRQFGEFSTQTVFNQVEEEQCLELDEGFVVVWQIAGSEIPEGGAG